jgi:hypothetical protein
MYNSMYYSMYYSMSGKHREHILHRTHSTVYYSMSGKHIWDRKLLDIWLEDTECFPTTTKKLIRSEDISYEKWIHPAMTG